MRLEAVHIQNLRCLEDLRFHPRPQINWLIGDNGQGKTSLLEGLYVLGNGNSFRDRGEQLIRLHETQMLVFGEVKGPVEQHRIGVLREKQQRVIKVDGEFADNAWILLDILPTLAITAENSQILNEAPQERRRLLDWGLFHVEPQYGDTLRQFRRSLKQRNAWLKNDGQGSNPWNRPFLEYAEALQQHRQGYIEALQAYFLDMLRTLTHHAPEAVTLSLHSGWSRQRTLADVLKHDETRDRMAGFTHSGPHRADIRFAWQGQDASSVLSRGQIKLWSHAFRLAQLRYLYEERAVLPVVLVDDFGAELDPSARERFLQVLLELDLQVFATVTHQSQIPALSPAESGHFLLEAGHLRIIEGKAA